MQNERISAGVNRPQQPNEILKYNLCMHVIYLTGEMS